MPQEETNDDEKAGEKQRKPLAANDAKQLILSI